MQQSLVQKYLFLKKTNYDNAGDNNDKMIGGYPLSELLDKQMGGGSSLGSSSYAKSELTNYAVPAGLVLTTTLFSEFAGGKRHFNNQRTENSDFNVIGDSEFDRMFGAAAHSISQKRSNGTHKKRMHSKNQTKARSIWI